MKALFLAGGSGTRLWPLSRQSNPKQLQCLVGDSSLMTRTISRISPIVKPQDIWIVTNHEYTNQIAAHSDGVPTNQIISEPFPLGTNLAVGLGLIHIAREFPNATVVVGWADAHIGREANFHDALQRAALLADEVDGVILAARPTYAATGYGYIETGEAISGHPGCFEIARFEEKPDPARAAVLAASEKHYWNPGISVWKAARLLELMKQHIPDHFEALQEVATVLGTQDEELKIRSAFADLERISIDNAIFEKVSRMATVPVDMDWSDVGSWSAIYDISASSEENVTTGSVVAVDTKRCLIFSQKRLIATLGVSDLVIVETDDAVLVAHKDDTERLKELYKEVEKFGGHRFL